MPTPVTIRRKAVVESDGTIRLTELPFAVGEEVEITLRPAPAIASGKPIQGTRSPLAGTVHRYENPTEPIADEEWEASQ